MAAVELRCDGRKLLAKLHDVEPGQAGVIELACDGCARRKRQQDPSVRRVLHQFSLDGVLIETITV